MIFTTVTERDTEEEILINLDHICYIRRGVEEGEYDLWFSHERGLGFNAITVGPEDANKIFALIKEYALKLNGAETEL